MSRIRSSLIALLLCLLGQGLHGQGQPEQGFSLDPAEARYRIRISGVPTGMEARIALQQPLIDHYQLDFTVQHPLIRHHETSQFQWHSSCRARPLGYSYRSSGFGIKRGGDVRFDWDARTAHGSEVSFPVPLDVTDALGLAMMARCDLHRGRHNLIYDVAEPDGIARFTYRIVGEEQLALPAGTFSTIKIERLYPQADRRTYMWAARELNYFMVRMDHIENAVLRGKMEMVSFTPQTPQFQASATAGQALTP